MHDFRYVGKKLFCEGVAVETLAKKFGTPLYVYSQRTLTDHFQKLDRALAPLDHLICFAMKANSNLSVHARAGESRQRFRRGERRRIAARHRGGRRSAEMRFCRRGAKRKAEIEFALRQGIYSFNVESEPEIAAHQPRRRAAEENRANRRARESERRGQDARKNHHRHLRKQIRHRVRAHRRRLCARRQN